MGIHFGASAEALAGDLAAFFCCFWGLGTGFAAAGLEAVSALAVSDFLSFAFGFAESPAKLEEANKMLIASTAQTRNARVIVPS